MTDSIKALRKENEALKGELKSVVADMLTLKAKFEEQSPPSQTSTSEQAKSLQYLSDEYDDLKLFKSSTEKEIKRLNTRLTEISLKVDSISDHIDSIEQYSYKYNVKIFGIHKLGKMKPLQISVFSCSPVSEQPTLLCKT
jgi:chromosome segregation ATPase